MALTLAEEDDLLIGGLAASWSERERREAWFQHRAALMERGGAGWRPAAWWDCEAGDDAPPLVRPHGMSWLEHDLVQLAYLVEHDMDEQEAAELIESYGASHRDDAPALAAVVIEAFPQLRGHLEALRNRHEGD